MHAQAVGCGRIAVADLYVEKVLDRGLQWQTYIREEHSI